MAFLLSQEGVKLLEEIRAPQVPDDHSLESAQLKQPPHNVTLEIKTKHMDGCLRKAYRDQNHCNDLQTAKWADRQVGT